MLEYADEYLLSNRVVENCVYMNTSGRNDKG
jgi:hypothetical protein